MRKKKSGRPAPGRSGSARKAVASTRAPQPAEPDRKYTINDIARLANVSKKTVSRVINESPAVREETRTRVAAVMQRVAYTPDPQARGLAFRRSFLVGLIYDNRNAPYVINIQEGALAALRRMGYELIVHPCDRTSEQFLPEIRDLVTRQRLDGVILPPEYIAQGSYTFESGVTCAEMLLSRVPRPTAIFAGNDETAAGVYRTAYLRGLKIPDDLTVIGFDDSPLASRLCPSLTTMRQPIREMGRVAAEKVIAMVGHTPGPPAAESTFHPHLVVRESSGRPGT